MFAKLLPLLRTKRGLVGAFLLFYGAVRGVLGLLQDVTYAASNWGTIVDFLASGLGNVVVIIAGIVLILWVVLTQQPQAENAHAQPSVQAGGEQNSSPPATDSEAIEQLRTRLREVEQERDELKQQNEELAQKVDERKRMRVEGWREFFDNFDYVNENILLTAPYSDISPFLKNEIKDALQNRSRVRVELDNRTGTSDTLIRGQSPASQRTLLLDEVTRIEREEWERL